MKVRLEEIQPDRDSSFKILLTPNLNEVFYWHYHPEYEIVFVEGASGTRHIGDHISRYEGSDLVFIGPNVPHLNFDYGVKSVCETIVVQMTEDFLGKDFFLKPELSDIHSLFEKARYGLSFDEQTKQVVGKKLKQLISLNHFEQLMELLQIFQVLATSSMQVLNSKPVADQSIGRHQGRIQKVHAYVEQKYQEKVDVHEAASICNLSTAAFCRYFRNTTRMTFTDFVNQYRIVQAKKLLLQGATVTEACYDAGFENLSYFNRTFRRFAGENPSHFRKNNLLVR